MFDEALQRQKAVALIPQWLEIVLQQVLMEMKHM